MTVTIKTLPHYFPEVFAQRIIISLLIFAVLCVLSVLLFRRKRISKPQFIASLILSAYVVILLYLTVIGRYTHEEYCYQIYIYKSYRHLIENFEWQSLKQIIINIGMMIPVGFLFPMVINSKRKYALTLVFSLVLILLIESLQLIMKCGSFEVDDIINNMVGAVIGMLLYALAHSIFTKKSNNVVD